MAANLKQLKNHVKSIGNIQKITGSMKMVSAARFIQAEKSIAVARPMGVSARKFYSSLNVSIKTEENLHLLVAFTSDRGLCGSCHNKVVKTVKNFIREKPGKYHICCIGEKSRSIIAFDNANLISLVVNGIGHRTPTFLTASAIASRILTDDFYHGTLVFPSFKNMLSYQIVTFEIYSSILLSSTQQILKYDSTDYSNLKSYIEFTTAVQIFYALCDTYLVELSARINAMSAASKNAGKLKKTLMLQYNRVRQSLVTRELIDIIGGASVVIKKKQK